MYRLHIYLIKSFIRPFVVTFFTAIFILLMQFLWKYIDDLVGKGFEFSKIAELIFYASARFVPLALPIATLLTSVMIFGKMGENYELVALKSAGISLLKLLFPLTVITILISICSFIFSNYVYTTRTWIVRIFDRKSLRYPSFTLYPLSERICFTDR